MKFNIEVDMDSFTRDDWFNEDCFEEYLKEKVYDEIINKFYRVDYSEISYNIKNEVSNIVKDNKEYIINRVVESVTDSILKKKEIIAITPKAKELSDINSENEKYFMGLIDKAIAKKFK